MPDSMRSLDDALSNAADYGMLRRSWLTVGVSTTIATVSSGYVTMQRLPDVFTIPSVTSPVTGFYPTFAHVLQTDTSRNSFGLMLCKEVLLGTLTVSGNSYAHGSAIGTIQDPGDRASTLTGAASLIVAHISTTIAGTTPILTFNYTNQAGTTGRSGTITIPTNAVVGSVFLMSPSLQSGDSGIRQLSASGPNGLSISTGTSGVIRVCGLFPLAIGLNAANGQNTQFGDQFATALANYQLVANDTIAIYSFGTNAALRCVGSLVAVPTV